ncbi:uncharacterized protein LOC34620778 [Cyclospora cayetanensis]|uniref:Uncharacterized protein LOC34620778 n=1 Tax=Cyclospora cayetanensis TaxID=88456 RepID=A0A6P6RUS8_9EIME|nr:uncharacterized protein LOC34620778 [Cyclospora cayetanensis]
MFGSTSKRGTSLSPGDSGLYPEFKVSPPVVPLTEVGSPRQWFFVNNKGIPVCCYTWDVTSAKATVVLVHGYGSHCMYEWLRTDTPETVRETAEPLENCNSKDSQGTEEDRHEEVKFSWSCCKPTISVTRTRDEATSSLGSRAASMNASVIATNEGAGGSDVLKQSIFNVPGSSPEQPQIQREDVIPQNEAPKLSFTGSWVERFLKRGWRVVGIDLQSHGASHGWDGTSCQVQTFDDFVQDIRTLLQSVANESSLPIFLVGTGMGGCAVIRAAELLCKAGMLGKATLKVAEGGTKSLADEHQLAEESKAATVSTASTHRDPQEAGPQRPLLEGPLVPTLREGSEAQETVQSPISAAAEAMGASHRVIRQKPVPLAGLVLLSPLLEAPQGEEYRPNCLISPFLGVLKDWLPHCGVVPRPQNDLYPDVDALFTQDRNTFKGPCRINLGMELLDGVKAAQADAYWLRRPITRDALMPFSLSDWAKLLHRKSAEKSHTAEGGGSLVKRSLKTHQGLHQEAWGTNNHEKALKPVEREAPQAHWLSVLVVQSLDDTVVPPLGSVRFFERLGGRAKLPEAWASIRREERRLEREARRAMKAAEAEEVKKQEEEEASQEDAGKVEWGHRSSAAFEAEFLSRAAERMENQALSDLRNAEIASRIAEMAAASEEVNDEAQGFMQVAVDAIKSASDIMKRASTLGRLASSAETRLATANGEADLAQAFARMGMMSKSFETLQTQSRLEVMDSPTAESGTDCTSVGESSACESQPDETVEVQDHQQVVEDKAPEVSSQAMCGCCTGKQTADGKRSKMSKRNHGSSNFFACCTPGMKPEGKKQPAGLYWKRKRWGAVEGFVVDEHGCMVKVDDADALMKEVRATGLDPLPEIDLQTEGSTDEELETELPADDIEEKFSTITNIAEDGALQLWLLRGHCHMLTKEPRNEELQLDIIDRFIEPTISRLCKSEGSHQVSA